MADIKFKEKGPSEGGWLLFQTILIAFLAEYFFFQIFGASATDNNGTVQKMGVYKGIIKDNQSFLW